jgi:hypothetical protein
VVYQAFAFASGSQSATALVSATGDTQTTGNNVQATAVTVQVGMERRGVCQSACLYVCMCITDHDCHCTGECRLWHAKMHEGLYLTFVRKLLYTSVAC